MEGMIRQTANGLYEVVPFPDSCSPDETTAAQVLDDEFSVDPFDVPSIETKRPRKKVAK